MDNNVFDNRGSNRYKFLNFAKSWVSVIGKYKLVITICVNTMVVVVVGELI